MRTLSLIVRLFHSAAKIQRKRMVLTVTAIAWGTVTIILLLSFGVGLKHSMDVGRRGMGDSLIVFWMGETGKAFAGLTAGRPIRLVPEDVDLVLRGVPEVASASGEMHNPSVQLVRGSVVLNKRVVGVEPAYGELRSSYARAGGRYIDELDQRLKRRVAFLGNELAESLFGHDDPVGRTFLVADVPFTVIGVMQKKKQMGMYGGPDSDRASIPLSTFEAMFGRRTLSNLIFRPVSVELAPIAKRHVFEVLGAKYRFDPTDTRVLPAWDSVQDAKLFDDMMLGFQIFLGVIGSLTLIIGGVGVANIMFAAVTHRTREIGVQMALGARRIYITGALVLESLALTFLGGVCGIGVGVAIVQALGAVQAHAKSEAMEFLGTPTISLPVAITTVTLLGAIGLLAGYFPARRAVSVAPAVALRYE